MRTVVEKKRLQAGHTRFMMKRRSIWRGAGIGVQWCYLVRAKSNINNRQHMVFDHACGGKHGGSPSETEHCGKRTEQALCDDSPFAVMRCVVTNMWYKCSKFLFSFFQSFAGRHGHEKALHHTLRLELKNLQQLCFNIAGTGHSGGVSCNWRQKAGLLRSSTEEHRDLHTSTAHHHHYHHRRHTGQQQRAASLSLFPISGL